MEQVLLEVFPIRERSDPDVDITHPSLQDSGFLIWKASHPPRDDNSAFYSLEEPSVSGSVVA